MAKANGTKVITNKVRLSFAHLFEPWGIEGQEKKFGVVILIPKDDSETLDALEKAKKAAYEDGKDSKLKGIKFSNVKFTLRDGDEEAPDGSEEAYEGHYFMNLSSKTAPGVIDAYKNKIDDSTHIKSGDYARVSLNCFAYNSAGNKGISAGLNNVQKIAEGEALGGRARAEDEFDEWDEEDENVDDIL